MFPLSQAARKMKSINGAGLVSWRWSLNQLRTLESSVALTETLRARASRHAEVLVRSRPSLPDDYSYLASVASQLERSFSSFENSAPQTAVADLDRCLRTCVGELRDAGLDERLHPITQSLLSSSFANLISARVLLWRINQLDGPRPPPLPSSTDGWNPTDIPATLAAEAISAGVFGETPFLSDIVLDAVDDMRAFCREKFGDVPEVDIRSPQLMPMDPEISATDQTAAKYAAPDCLRDGPVVVPPYVQFVLHELLKNALASHIYRVGVERIDELPDIELRYGIQSGWGQVTILDHGGGWPAGGAERAVKFMYTTRPGRARGHGEASWQYSRAHGSQLEGLGVGLALSELHARFLGGDLALGGLPGQGAHVTFFFDVTGDRTDCSPVLLPMAS